MKIDNEKATEKAVASYHFKIQSKECSNHQDAV